MCSIASFTCFKSCKNDNIKVNINIKFDVKEVLDIDLNVNTDYINIKVD